MRPESYKVSAASRCERARFEPRLEGGRKGNFIRCNRYSNIMSYYELWTILGNWRREFTSGDFERTFPSPDSRKVLHDMAKKGLLERLEYGRYKVKSIDDYVKTRNDVMGAYYLLKKCPLSVRADRRRCRLCMDEGGLQRWKVFRILSSSHQSARCISWKMEAILQD